MIYGFQVGSNSPRNYEKTMIHYDSEFMGETTMEFD